MSKQYQLDTIAEEIKHCKICQENKVGLPVPGEGNPNADIVFVGEAPGKQEAKTGRPFVGRSGHLLRNAIRSIGLEEKEVYITSPVKYLPIHITPTLADIEHGKTHFLKQIEIIDPKVLVLMGNTAVIAVLGEKLPILKRHGEIIEKDGKKYFLSLHPAAAVRFEKFRRIFEEDFLILKHVIHSRIL